MKLPITDKFLLDLYNFIENAGSDVHPLFLNKTMKQTACPEYFKMKKNYEKEKRKIDFACFVNNLKRRGYIKTNNSQEKKAILLTPKGAEKAFIAKLKTSKRRKRQDEKWIMIMFDIPEEKRKLRNILREYLNFLDYQLIQKSVWVCPYDVKKETEMFIERYALDKYIKVFLIEKI